MRCPTRSGRDASTPMPRMGYGPTTVQLAAASATSREPRSCACRNTLSSTSSHQSTGIWDRSRWGTPSSTSRWLASVTASPPSAPRPPIHSRQRQAAARRRAGAAAAARPSPRLRAAERASVPRLRQPCATAGRHRPLPPRRRRRRRRRTVPVWGRQLQCSIGGDGVEAGRGECICAVCTYMSATNVQRRPRGLRNRA